MAEQFYVDVQPGYQPLASELYIALEQSQGGKGKERHANGKPFLQQPMMEITRMTGPGGAAYQVMKKTQEAVSMANRGEYDRAIAELHGAIVYAAGCAMAIREKKPNAVDWGKIGRAAAPPIPDGVYWSYSASNFYDQLTNAGKGDKFFEDWHDRRTEFPTKY